ncbi:MAG: LuxR C-terminal-related transcriptional regulator [Anaerolineaceae bacterium]|nr:LuxR C-terminal-related transcriptional regulator [Anaerolineaceae bacterium]
MSIWHTFQKFFRPEANPSSQRSFTLEGDLLLSLEQLARYRGSTPRKVAADLLARELQSVEVERETWEKWQSLTEREQQVAALICLQYRTQQIATRLQIAPETVRSHVHNILHKMDLPNRIALRQLLAGWDFSSWA